MGPASGKWSGHCSLRLRCLVEEAGEVSTASCDLKGKVLGVVKHCIPGELQAGIPERHSLDVNQQGLGAPAS